MARSTRRRRYRLPLASMALALVLGADDPPRPAAAVARAEPAPRPAGSSIAEAIKLVETARERYKAVDDYTCTFFKRERIDGELSPIHGLAMKARTKPRSFYFKITTPKPGREAIYVAGQNGGKGAFHDVGFNKLLAGTLWLDPRASLAMRDCRHPISDAGIGHLIDTVHEAWTKELTAEESRVSIHRNAKVGDRPCLMVESVHTKKSKAFLFHKVNLYLDAEHGLPIRFEAYDWPAQDGGVAPLVEEYTYTHLKLNVGLRDRDFDVANRAYSFGRF